MNGIENEYEFVKYLNGKKVKELNPRSRELIDYLFENLSEETIITSWKKHFKQKTDIFIKANGIMKGISIKMGSKNYVHIDSISNFTDFLYRNEIPIKIINYYWKYHFADGTINGKGKYRQSVEEYKKKHQKEIELINKYFNTEKMVELAIDRFILKGNNSKYDIDALIYGEYNDFLWISKENIYKVILEQKEMSSSAVHFGPIIVQPKTRCLNYNSKYEKDRFCVQIKWYSLFDDIMKTFLYTSKR